MCKSVCDSERRSCKADIHGLAREEYDGPIMLESRQRNEIARTAEKTQVPSPATRATEQRNTDTRRMRYAAACEDKYARCTRSCTIEAAPQSEVLVKKPATK
ncbi:hypothetical protein G4G28_14175 [Massilia sp. Dwa41.01b]|uniref:hypothetical protein n=1 Tax=unclassified Massilia TaxID=2609279 RepID=UPI001601286D|nr:MULTISPECIES: hypothetical protein [unclassified Massilia]QNA89332.1 hypothetical protein G4G28_14175 [Massilia sp. Dwa41.01b]QNB00231.1 hypothetical protein G4G31_17755 [Massilia sp. Se16.2.3]